MTSQLAIAEFSFVSTLTNIQSRGFGRWLMPKMNSGCRFMFEVSEALSELIIIGKDKDGVFLAFPEALKALLVKSDMKIFYTANDISIWVLVLNREMEVVFPGDGKILQANSNEAIEVIGNPIDGKFINVCTYRTRRGYDFDITAKLSIPLFKKTDSKD
jgi:hypothetical protein